MSSTIRGIEIDTELAQRYAQALTQAPEIAMEELGRGLEECGLLYVREIQEAAMRPDFKFSGTFAQSIAMEREDSPLDARVKVFSPLNYAAPLELGSRPHWAPIEPLQDWVAGKLGITEPTENFNVARSIQRKIAARGTKPKNVFGSSADRLAPQWTEILRTAIARLFGRLQAL